MQAHVRGVRPSLRLLACALAIVLLLAACNDDAADEDAVLEIPYAGPLSGPIATFGLENVHGVELAVNELNEAGGLASGPWAGHKIRVVHRDDQGDPTEAATIATGLADDSDVLLVLGHLFSTTCLAALPIYEAAGLAMVTSVCSAPEITQQDFETVIRLAPNDSYNGAAQFDLAVEHTSPQRVAIAYPNDDYGRGVYRAMEQAATEAGIETVVEAFEGGDVDFSAIISRFEAAGADVIVTPAFYNEAALLRQQSLGAGFDVPFVGGPGAISSELVRIGGDEVEGTLIVDFIIDEEVEDPDHVQRLREELERDHGESFNFYHRTGYDKMRFVITALENAESADRADVLAALKATEIVGLNGLSVRVDETGDLVVEDPTDLFVMRVVEDGEFVLSD